MKKLIGFLSSTIALVTLLSFSIGVAEAKKYELPAINSDDFVTVINNPYFPLDPGTTFIYKPLDEDNVVDTMEVTFDTKEILGVTCIVVHDWETVDGELTEDTYDWYAQDKYGNVWYFGEDTTAFLDDGTISKEGSWEAGKNGAEAGIIMLADPIAGLSYQQEYSKDIAEDMAKVLRLDARVSLENGDSFEDCLKTKEWTPLNPGVIENKYYAPGVGLVLIEELKEKTVRVELVDKY